MACSLMQGLQEAGMQIPRPPALPDRPFLLGLHLSGLHNQTVYIWSKVGVETCFVVQVDRCHVCRGWHVSYIKLDS